MVRVLALVTSLVLAGPLAAFAQVADPGAAAAAEEENYGRDGFYVGASLAGVSFMGLANSVDRGVTDFTGDDAKSKTETTMGVNFRLGYRMHPRVAAEAQWEWLVPSDISVTLNDEGNFLTDDSALEVRVWTVTANLKGYILTKGDVQPFLLLGGGIISGELDGRSVYGVSNDGFSFLGRMGGGLDYYFTPHIVGVAELTYVLPTGNLDDFPYISGGLGLQYRF